MCIIFCIGKKPKKVRVFSILENFYCLWFNRHTHVPKIIDLLSLFLYTLLYPQYTSRQSNILKSMKMLYNISYYIHYKFSKYLKQLFPFLLVIYTQWSLGTKNVNQHIYRTENYFKGFENRIVWNCKIQSKMLKIEIF